MKKKLFPILLLVLSIPAVYFLLIPGFYEPHDLHHLADIYEMVRAITSGQIPPRLGPDFSFGYGYPLFNFYYILPFYLGAFLFLIFRSLQFSFEMVFVISVILSLSGMYLFLKEYLNKWSALVGAIVFLYTPYRAVQIYVRGAMGEAFSLALLPWVSWALAKIIKTPKNYKVGAVASFIFSIFILSHNYFWVLTLPWLILLVFILIHKNKFQAVKLLLASLFLSFGMTAFWWLPALTEQKLVASVTPFPLIDHFPFLKQLILPSWGYGSSVWGPGDQISFQIGVVNLVVFIFLTLLLLIKPKYFDEKIKGIVYWTIAGFLISVFFMNIRSYFLWKLIPFHDFIQFPWRLLALTTFFTSVMTGILVNVIKIKGRTLGLIIIISSIFVTFSYFRPSKLFYKSDNDYLERFFADRTIAGKAKEVSNQYFTYSEDYLLLPKWVEKRASFLPQSRIESNDFEILNVQEISPVKWAAEVSGGGGLVTFNSYYFPGWFAKIDAKVTNIAIGQPYGQIEISVPPGNHDLLFYWKETGIRKASDLVSLLSLFFAMFYFIYGKAKKTAS